jgi:hypothetical protein
MTTNTKEIRKPGGFGRVMSGLNESDAKQKLAEKVDERTTEVMRLKEKFEKNPGLGFGKGKLDEMFNKNPRKASNLVMFLEQTEIAANSNRTLVESQRQYEHLREAVATSGFLGVTPQDIVKVARIAYPNSVAPDIFDFWGMSSMKDSIFKLETLYGQTNRGSTVNTVTYENYGEGRFPSEIEKNSITATSAQTEFKASSLTNAPLRPFTLQIFVDGVQVAADDGNGLIVGASLTGGAADNFVTYSTGAFEFNFTVGITLNSVVDMYYQFDSEQSGLFAQVGSALLNLVVYDYRATPYPLAIEWTRFTEELMQSKLGMSAKESLIAGAADIFRKSLDEWCITRASKASNWTTAVSFDTDFASAGSDSSYEHAQSVLNAIQNAELKTYADLGRMADKSNVVCDYMSFNYLSKHRDFNFNTPASRIGIFKGGEIAGRDVYVAPPSLVAYDSSNKIGLMYIFGKGNDPMSVDSVLSVGTWKAGVTTDPIELKNFNSQMGMCAFMDVRVNNAKFATKVNLTNLTANS